MKPDGHAGTWHTVDEREYAGEFFFMEHDEYGSDVAGIIVSEHSQLVWPKISGMGMMRSIGSHFRVSTGEISVEEPHAELEPDELAYKIDDRVFAIREQRKANYTRYALDFDKRSTVVLIMTI